MDAARNSVTHDEHQITNLIAPAGIGGAPLIVLTHVTMRIAERMIAAEKPPFNWTFVIR
jgi:hypothetical protein